MMKGVSKGAMAVRLPDGSIDVEDWDIKPKNGTINARSFAEA